MSVENVREQTARQGRRARESHARADTESSRVRATSERRAPDNARSQPLPPHSFDEQAPDQSALAVIDVTGDDESKRRVNADGDRYRKSLKLGTFCAGPHDRGLESEKRVTGRIGRGR